MNNKKTLSIADPTVPNAGRIYDYLIGGHHNFEVDRQAAQKVLEMAPFMPHTLRLIRWFLGEAAMRLAKQGHTRFLDFASGLPVQDHIHQIAPSGSKVIYSDIDPVTVQYGRDILGDNADVKYLEGDAATPETVLNSSAIKELFGEERQVVIGINGVAYFLTDDQMQHSLKTLYDWAAEGSRLFICDADAYASETSDSLKVVFDFYAGIGQPIYIRTKEKLFELAQPWRVEEPGPMYLDEWVGVGREITEKEIEEWGGRGFYGVILAK